MMRRRNSDSKCAGTWTTTSVTDHCQQALCHKTVTVGEPVHVWVPVPSESRRHCQMPPGAKVTCDTSAGNWTSSRAVYVLNHWGIPPAPWTSLTVDILMWPLSPWLARLIHYQVTLITTIIETWLWHMDHPERMTHAATIELVFQSWTAVVI